MAKTANPKRAGILRVGESGATYGQSRPYDLEARTFQFPKEVRAFVKKLPRTVGNLEDVKQLVRASGSVGANYIEANESLGKKDVVMKIKTCWREAKECGYFLRLLDVDHQPSHEAGELMNIFGAIYRKCE